MSNEGFQIIKGLHHFFVKLVVFKYFLLPVGSLVLLNHSRYLDRSLDQEAAYLFSSYKCTRTLAYHQLSYSELNLHVLSQFWRTSNEHSSVRFVAFPFSLIAFAEL